MVINRADRQKWVKQALKVPDNDGCAQRRSGIVAQWKEEGGKRFSCPWRPDARCVATRFIASSLLPSRSTQCKSKPTSIDFSSALYAQILCVNGLALKR